MKKTWLLDSGHGGMINGVYQTAPWKMFAFKDQIAYEGVINRNVKNLLISKLNGRAFIDLINSEEDISLSSRVSLANSIYHTTPNAVYFSIHSNASPDHTGTGFEVWTSKGQTYSDKIANVLCQEIKAEFTNIKFRSDSSDNDLDKESDFYVLHNTRCPAVLIENLFFDNYNDYLRLTDPVFLGRLVDVYIRWIDKIEKSII